MRLIVIQKILSSTKEVLYRAQANNKNIISNSFFKVIQRGIGFLIATALFLFFAGDKFGEHAWWLVILVAIIAYLYNSINIKKKFLAQHEPLAVMLPFEKLHLLLTLVGSYLLFLDGSIRAVLIAIAAIVVLFWTETGIHQKELSPHINKILVIQSLNTIAKLMLGFVLLHMDKIEYYLYFTFFMLLPPLLAFLRKPNFNVKLSTGHGNSWLPITYTIVKYLNSFAFVLVVADFGLDVAVLFSLLGVVLTMIFGRYFLDEKFTWKDIIVALTLFGLMAVGFYWK